MTEREVIGELVQRLGGATVIGRTLGCGAQPVSKWRILGRVPWKWRHLVREMAHEHKLELTKQELIVLALFPEKEAAE